MSKQPTLTVILPGTQQVRADGCVNIPEKTVTGLEAYARYWDGPVEVVMRGASVDEGFGLGARWRDPSTLSVPLHLISDISEIKSLAGSRLLLLPHHPEFSSLLESEHLTVLTSELPAAEVLRAELLSSKSAIDRLRVKVGARRREMVLRQMSRNADGLQCNGWPSWGAYAKHSPNPMRYYDTRLTAAHVTMKRTRDTIAADGVLRLAFSGRLFENKGPRYALELSSGLDKQAIDHELLVIGDGPDRDSLKGSAPRQVRFVDPMDFESEWVRLMLEKVDIGVLPHMQGDPSGTYLEMAGLGVPVIGFRNAALLGLEHYDGVGWTCDFGDVNSLVEKVQDFTRSAGSWKKSSDIGRKFMSEHYFEKEFMRRITHLKELVLAAR